MDEEMYEDKNVIPSRKKRKHEESEQRHEKIDEEEKKRKELIERDEGNKIGLDELEEQEFIDDNEEELKEDNYEYYKEEETQEEIANQDETVNQYVAQAFSCVEHVHKQIKFPLLPIAINQELKIIRQTLIHKWKYRFINELDGFLYYFDNLEVIGDNNGYLLDDLPFIYYNLIADFYIFKPKIGDYLKAKISCFEDSNKVINCSTDVDLIISIQLPEEINEKLNKYLKLHQDIIFLIKDVNYTKMIIEGVINKRSIKLMEQHIELISTNEQNYQNESNLDDFFAD